MISDTGYKSIQIAIAAARTKGAEDLLAIEVSGQLPFSDAFLMMSGNSERNVLAIADAVEADLISAGIKPARREGLENGRWVLLDFGDLIVHVFHPEERLYYGLERLWMDCPTISLAELIADDVSLSSDATV